MNQKLTKIKNYIPLAGVFNSLTVKKKLILTALAILLIGGVYLSFTQIKTASNNTKEQHVVKELDNLKSKENLTCEEVINKIGGLSADNIKDIQKKTEFLQRQIYCFSDQLMYDRAIAAAEELKAVYQKEGNTELAERTDAAISEMSAIKKEIEAENNQPAEGAN